MEEYHVTDEEGESGHVATVNTAARSGIASFMDVNLKNVSQGLAFFKSHYMQYVTNIEAECNDRFCTKDSASLLNYTCIVDTNLWLTDSETLKESSGMN